MSIPQSDLPPAQQPPKPAPEGEEAGGWQGGPGAAASDATPDNDDVEGPEDA